MPYQIGLAKIDIAPPIGIYLAGYANRLEPSEGVYLQLTATAIAICDGQESALIIGAEILGFYEHTDRVRKAIGEKTGLLPHQILLFGSHTHCGPVLRDVDRERHGALDENYIDTLVAKIADCAQQAWNNREPSLLKFGTGTCNFASNRRMPDENGAMQMRPNPNGIFDHTVSVLAIETPQNKLRGVLFSYACHPTSRSGLLIGGDYVGFALQYVEQTHPATTACFLQGCAGDQKPGPIDPNSKSFSPREVDEVRVLGKQLGQAVNAILNTELDTIDGQLAPTHTTINLETEHVDWNIVETNLESSKVPMCNWAQHFHALKEQGHTINTCVPFEIQTLTFGSTLALVALSGEISVEYALRLKRELTPTFSHALIAAYANRIIGYVPVQRQIPEGGYEIWTNQYTLKRTGPFVAETEDHICQTVHAQLNCS